MGYSYFIFQGRLVNLSCSSVPSFVVSITAATQVSLIGEQTPNLVET